MIAVISDSHVPDRSPGIPQELQEILEKADEVIHCGDFETEEFYQKLDREYGLLAAVRGNCDFFDLPQSQIVEFGDLDVGVYHGTGINPRGHKPTLADIAENKLEVDVLLSGHTHHQRAVRHEGSILLNPGSCTGVGGGSARRGSPEMMTLELDDGTLEVELIVLDDGELLKEEKEFEV